MERLPTHAFGYKFTHIPEFVREDVESLEREGVLYSDQWVEELGEEAVTVYKLREPEAIVWTKRLNFAPKNYIKL